MNISLAPSKKKAKTAKSLGYGLNARKETSGNVFGDDDEEEDEDPTSNSRSERGRVNQQIVKEQAALRQRAQAAVAAMGETDANLYDYDGAYDSFHQESSKQEATKTDQPKESQYIGDLLKAAKKRERERDVIHERKVAREQAEEDAKEEFQGKEKFVTKAYRRKLEERKQWEAEEEEMRRQEEANDVTKKVGGAAMASFYGNFSKNVAMGAEGEKGDQSKEDGGSTHKNEADDLDEFPRPGASGGLGFLAGFEKPATEPEPTKGPTDGGKVEPSSDEDKLTMREIREKKVAEARIRYLKRKELALQ